MQWPKPPGRSLMSVCGNAAPRGMTAHDRIRLTGPSAESPMVSRRVIRAVTPPTTSESASRVAIEFTEVTGPARFDCRIDLLLGILKASNREDSLVNCRSSPLRPCAGAVCAAGVGQTDRRVFMSPGEGAVPLQHRRQANRQRLSPASGIQAKSSHACAPDAPNSREENQRPGEHDSGAPMLCDDTICRHRRIIRSADNGWAQPIPWATLAVLPLSHTFMH